MSWEYINSDRALRKPNRIRFRMVKFSSAVAGEGPIVGCSTEEGSIDDDGDYNPRHGRHVNPRSKWVDVEFQFPPKVLSDGRKGNWKENDMAGGEEPVAVFKTSGPRELTLAWTYVVDSFDRMSSDSWHIERITRNLRTLRGYFALVRGRNGDRDNLAIDFHMWCIGGTKPITGRIKSIDIKYGETMVFPPATAPGMGLSDRAFPLRTDVTVDFRVWTKGLNPSREKMGAQDLKRLTDFEPPSWY